MRLFLFCFCLFLQCSALAYEWQDYPPNYPQYAFSDDSLLSSWSRLHTADRALKPTAPSVNAFVALVQEQGHEIDETLLKDIDGVVAKLKAGWKAYHQGDFKQAYQIGDALGVLGVDLVIRSKGMHHTYLLENEKDRENAFKELWEELKAKSAEWQVDLPNLHLGLVFSAGRYAQEISIGKALRLGMASYVREHTEAALRLAPDHPEALAFQGAFNSEIIGKAGGFLGRLTYGASKKKAKNAFENVLKLAPDDILIRLEVAQQYMHLGGESNLKQAKALIETVQSVSPYDAITALDRPRVDRMLSEIDRRLHRLNKKKSPVRKGF